MVIPPWSARPWQRCDPCGCAHSAYHSPAPTKRNTCIFPVCRPMMCIITTVLMRFSLPLRGGQAMKWVTRERPKIDRIACPWLIARFIDRDPEFLYVPAKDVQRVAHETGAIPYDVPDVELTHEGEFCSFDTFLKKYGLDDPALRQLAVIVRAADTDRFDLAPQAAGLFAISGA